MGVVKNLMVRIGADARGYVGGMKHAANETKSVSETVKKHTSGMKKTVGDCFAASRFSIKEYTAAVSKTKQDHAVATQNAERLSDRIQQLQSVYDTVKNATAGLDLSKPFDELRVDAEKALVQIESKSKKIEAQLRNLQKSPKGANSAKVASLTAELNALGEKSRYAVARMQDLDRVADAIGTSNIGYASTAGLQTLETEIHKTQNELNTTKLRAEELDAKLKSLGVLPTVGHVIKNIGTTAAQAARTGVSALWQKLKSIGGSALRGIASLPSKLRSIGRSASSSCGGLGKMVRSIRNIGIASLGMRIAGGMFGRLRSIISSYISQNESLNASVTSLRNQMGEALLPAINLVLAAMQKLMPVVTAVSHGINSILTSLFGDMMKTTAGIKKAADAASSLETYGFDKITKASDSSSNASSSGSGSSQSALVKQLTGWIQKLKAAFVAGDWKRLGQTVGDGINSAVAAIDAIDIGAKFGTFANNLVTTVDSALSTIDFGGIGTKLGQMFKTSFEKIDWSQAGNAIGSALTALPSIAANFILSADWHHVSQSVSKSFKAAFSSVSTWLQSVDWLQIGQSLADLVTGIDYGGIVSEAFRLLGAAIGACIGLLWGSLDGAVESICGYFSEKIEAAGGNVGKGLLNGILDGLGNIGNWFLKNVIKPFVSGIGGLHSNVVDVIEGMINSIVGGVNKLIGGINKVLSLGKNVGIDLGPIPMMSEVSLPRAARGTVVSSATKLEIGEDGTEAVVPLERHTEWMDVVAEKLHSKMSGGGGLSGSAIIQIFLGSRKLTEYIIKDINQLTKENGVCPIYT